MKIITHPRVNGSLQGILKVASSAVVCEWIRTRRCAIIIHLIQVNVTAGVIEIDVSVVNHEVVTWVHLKSVVKNVCIFELLKCHCSYK